MLLKLIKGISFTSIITIAPIVAVISCSSSTSKNYSRQYTFEKIDWSKISYNDATVTSWIDGDTLKFILDGETKEQTLRVEMIDTPESHIKDGSNWVDTVGKEHDYAIQATEFGKREIPAGSKVRLTLATGGTYGRRVGTIMYGEHFDKSYEVNVVRAGLALPFIESAALYLKMQAKYNMLHYLALPIADAYNFANNNKLGMFKENLDELLIIHGTTDLTAVIDKNENTSIYGNLDVDAW